MDELINAHLKTLPAEVISAVSGFNWAETMQVIGQKYGLPIDKAGILYYESLAAAIGLANPADFPRVAKDKLKLNAEQTVNIVNDVNERVFSILRNKIKEATGGKKTDTEEIRELKKEVAGDDELAKEVADRATALPTEVQDLIIDPDLPEKIGLLATEYKIDPAALDALISSVLLAYLDPDQFATEAKSQFDLPDEKAPGLAKAAEAAIWQNVKGALKLALQKEESATKIEKVLGEIEEEKTGQSLLGEEEKKAAAVAGKKMLEEKLKGKFQIPGSQTTVAPPIGTVPVAPSQPAGSPGPAPTAPTPPPPT